MIKNNVTRMLDAMKINYVAFELPKEKVGAVEAAAILGVPLEQVFKTIVVTREGRNKPLLISVPGNREVDLKAVAKVLGEKKVFLPTEHQAEDLTGLQAGGISPLALLNRGFQILIDETAMDFEKIYISGGQRGINICLSPQDLVTLSNAKVENVAN